MSLRPFKESNGGPRLELADVGWRGGCSYLERLRELLTDRNMRHSFGGKEKKVNGNRNPSNSSVPVVTITLFVYFGLPCLLHALATLTRFCPPQPCGQGSGLLPSQHMDDWVAGRPGGFTRHSEKQRYPEQYQNELSLGSTNSLCFHCSCPHGVCRCLVQVLPTCLTHPIQVRTVLSSRLLNGCICTLTLHWPTIMAG